jgi:hypothetical protein
VGPILKAISDEKEIMLDIEFPRGARESRQQNTESFNFSIKPLLKASFCAITLLDTLLFISWLLSLWFSAMWFAARHDASGPSFGSFAIYAGLCSFVFPIIKLFVAVVARLQFPKWGYASTRSVFFLRSHAAACLTSIDDVN